MPVTKRVAHLGTSQNLIEYILDEKNSGEKVGVSSSLNCNVNTAFYEFKDIQKKYQMKGSRVAYHIIQSFSPLDKINQEQANEIGLKLCKELYPNFQCVVSTHIDKGHLHNHICINAINLEGRKLDDRLANDKEGLYALSDTSDKISAEYGCYIMPRKTYLKNKTKDYYFQYKEQSWKEKIQEDLERLIPKCNDIEELLEGLSILGYEIRRGKYIAVKMIGMQKFARINTINPKYSFNNLNKHFRNIRNTKLLGIKTEKDEFNKILYMKANESKIAIEKSQLGAKDKVYNEYQKTKYKEVQRYYQLKKQLEYLEKYNIKSLEDVENEIDRKRSEIKDCNIKLKKEKEDNDKILQKTELANDYIKLFKVYEYAMSYKEQDPKYILPKEVEIFLKIQEKLNIKSIDEAKQLIKNLRDARINISKNKNKILELQRELNHLDTIKEEKLSKSELFIHNIKFGGNRIDYANSNDKEYCINIPYSKEKIYIDKKYTAYNEKHQFYTLYLIDDKLYDLYNENNEKIGNITGVELEKYVLEKKKEIDKMYSEKNI